MTILPLSTPGRSTPNSQHSSYFPPSSSSSNGNNNGPTIGLPGQAGFRRKSDGGYGFNGSSASARVHGHHHQSSSMSSFVPLFLRRLFRFPHMDFQFALWQMVYLCISPRIVYRNIHYHKRKKEISTASETLNDSLTSDKAGYKEAATTSNLTIDRHPLPSIETKNQWARDDPAFMVILSGVLCCSAIAWGLVYGHGMMGILRMMLYMVFVDFVVIGVVVATICWTIANRFLARASVYSTEQSVEWQYAFDIHCNAFMPVIALLYIIQMVFMKVLVKDFWICSLLGNTLYMIAIVYYCYITFLGYNALPFLRHPEMFLYPITIFVVLYVLALILGINVSAKVLAMYFG